MRMIDADAFRRELDHHWPFTKEEQSKHGMADMAKSEVLFVLNQMPTIEERKNGKWICEERKRLIDETDEGRVYITDKWWKCSECGNSKGYVKNKPDDKFCNECGADMREKKWVNRD